jgi:hypothetical protein
MLVKCVCGHVHELGSCVECGRVDMIDWTCAVYSESIDARRIHCLCGATFEGNTICPDCRRTYSICERCRTDKCDDDVVDGVCSECWDEIMNSE